MSLLLIASQAGPRQPSTHAIDEVFWTIFETSLGWVGLAGTLQQGVTRLCLGYRTPEDLWQAVGDQITSEQDWDPQLRRRITSHLAGELQDFRDVQIAARQQTPFQRQVTDLLRQVSAGQTVTYKELATRAERPAASRAVGQIMATNPVPLIVPCHRVLGCGGRLGGFSAPTGIALKKQLLALEGIQCG